MSRRDPNSVLFIIGWLLVAVNFAAMAWAVYVPIGFYLYQQDVLFSLDTAQSYVKVNTLSVAALMLFGLVQVFYLGSLAKRMYSDTYETAAAEAALKIARAAAVVLIVVCVGSIIVDVMFLRRWVDAYIQFA
jgi:hypothetical protein